MTFLDMLRDATTRNDSLLCVGLDPEPTRFPAGMQGDPHKIYDFCAAIVDATADLVCAFKPQIAYFAAHGAEDQLERLMQHLRANAPHVPVILDAKRGDIGSTAEQYAREAFERYMNSGAGACMSVLGIVCVTTRNSRGCVRRDVRESRRGTHASPRRRTLWCGKPGREIGPAAGVRCSLLSETE
ncbi:orotidine 5'-phosphate decarboxylase / HUMPS family protein, partial [Diaphorobacter sp.]|uniref:orotidine 5'-phosphate decarboxylase / HUMPS family protein n=1 Tax=Diaphorobacter sp. TaxID=1934310 RepID=UPI0025862292